MLETYAGNGSVPGAVGLIACGERTEVAVAGSVAVDGVSMARDSIFRLASITKPITAAAVMMLAEDGRIALDDPVGQWLPELANRRSSAHLPVRSMTWSPRPGRSPYSTF
jgi:CubicO group peptidase (beta-lactamase class C family)